MGNLLKIPQSELHATLEVLEHLGVESRHFETIRKDPARASAAAQAIIAGYILVDPVKADLNSQLVSWQNLYLELGLKVDVSNLKIPASQPGFTRLILVPEGLTPNKAVALLKKKMSVYTYTDNLDTITSVRDTKKTYVIWVRDRIEADEELKNKSANDLKRDGINCITLIERLLYELKFFTETTAMAGQAQKHLDVKNWTLCGGSRNSSGNVPSVGWGSNGGGVGVYWDYADYRYGNSRSRVAVS